MGERLQERGKEGVLMGAASSLSPVQGAKGCAGGPLLRCFGSGRVFVVGTGRRDVADRGGVGLRRVLVVADHQ